MFLLLFSCGLSVGSQACIALGVFRVFLGMALVGRAQHCYLTLIVYDLNMYK